MMNSMMRNMFGGVGTGFSSFDDHFNMVDRHMNSVMSSMNSMNSMNRANQFFPGGNSSYYCSSSVMSYTTDMHGRPQIYEETQSTASGPSGLRETRHTLRDTSRGLQKMAIGHHIDERGHVIERSRNHYTGEEEENNEYINIEEEEAPTFNEEWRHRASMPHPYRNRRPLPAIDHRRAQSQPRLLALPGPSTDRPESHEQRNKMSHKKHKKGKKPYKKYD